MDVAEFTVEIVYSVPAMQIGSPLRTPMNVCPLTQVTAVPLVFTVP